MSLQIGGLLVGSLPSWLDTRMVERLADWSDEPWVGRSIGQLVGRLVDLWVGRSIGQLVGWLFD